MNNTNYLTKAILKIKKMKRNVEAMSEVKVREILYMQYEEI